MSNIAISYGNLFYPFILSPFLLEFDVKNKKNGENISKPQRRIARSINVPGDLTSLKEFRPIVCTCNVLMIVHFAAATSLP